MSLKKTLTFTDMGGIEKRAFLVPFCFIGIRRLRRHANVEREYQRYDRQPARLTSEFIRRRLIRLKYPDSLFAPACVSTAERGFNLFDAALYAHLEFACGE
jgi:hypothetical protein